MTKRQLNAARRAAKRPTPKQRRFRGWPWEEAPKGLGRLYIGRCRSKQGIAIFVPFRMSLLGSRRETLRDPLSCAPCCRHCGGHYEAVSPA